MKAGILLLIFADVVSLMQTRGIITPEGDFDETKLDTVSEDAAFAAGVEAILVSHGVHIPGKVDQIIKALPLLGLFIH